MYVSMNVCMYECMYVHVSVSICVCMCEYVCVCMCECVCVLPVLYPNMNCAITATNVAIINGKVIII